MTELAIVDCHLHIFPPLAGASGFPTAEAHLTHQQRAMHVHGNQPYRRTRDHAVVSERPLWKADDPSEAGRATDGAIPKERFALWLLEVIGQVRGRLLRPGEPRGAKVVIAGQSSASREGAVETGSGKAGSGHARAR